MPFEVFDHESAKRLVVDYPVITIQSNGAMRLNKAAASALKNPERVILLWDRQNNKMGISAAPAGDRRSYKVDYETGIAKLSPKAFLRYIGFTSEVSVRVSAELVKNMLEGAIPAENIQKSTEAQQLVSPRTRAKKPDLSRA